MTVVSLEAGRHLEALFDAVGGPEHDELWTYMFDGPFAERGAFAEWLRRLASSEDSIYYVVLERATSRPAALAALMRINPVDRVIEVGSIVYSPRLQRTRAATEAMYLMAAYVFETLGYRRYEWKCDALNAASRRAALRLGFTFEGIFRQHMIVKGRSRDTAWYSIIDDEWPARKARLTR